jgi:hypothetical protein
MGEIVITAAPILWAFADAHQRRGLPQDRVFPLCYAYGTSREKFIMHTLTRFAFTLAQLLVGGCMFGDCILVAHAQAQQQQQVVPPPPAPAASPLAPVYTPVSPPASNAALGSSVTSPVNESRSAARTHERTSVAKTVHHRGRIIAGWIPPPYWDGYYFVGWQCSRPCGRRWLGWWGAQ